MTYRKHSLAAGVSRSALSLALIIAGASAASAQTATPATPDATTPVAEPAPADRQATTAPPVEDEVIVTGIRASLANALRAKRDAPQVLDAISAEDIGKFPDKNMAEALQRVTGVQLARSSGEGQFVSIRGASPELNRVEINGQTALSTQVTSGRQVDFRDLPTEFVSRLEVVKSATPDMTEGGLGGTVRVITRRPFDSREGYLAGSAQVVYGDLLKKWDPKFAIIGSKLFANETIGVLASATFENRSLATDQARTTGWRRIDRLPAVAGVQPLDLNADGTGDFYPDIPRLIINREQTKRYAFNGIVEFRPTDDFKAFVEGTFTTGNQTLDSQFLQLTTAINTLNGGVVPAETVVGPDDTVTRVRFDSALAAPGGLGVSFRNILGQIKRRTFNSQAGFDWTRGQFELGGRLFYSKVRAYNNEINATADALGLSTLTIDYDNGQNAPNIILPFDPTGVSELDRLTILRQPRYNHQRETGGKLDAQWKPEGAFLRSIKVGVEKRDLFADSILFAKRTTLNGFNGTTAVSNTLNGTGQVDVVTKTETPAIVTGRLRDIVAANATLGDHDFFSTGDLGFSGIQRWLNLGNSVADAVGIPDPFDNPLPLDTWEVTDKNLAGYAQAGFEFNLGFPISGVVGTRVIRTKTISEGNQVRAGVVTPVKFTGQYTEVLPSLNLRGQIIPNKLLVRAAASEVLARPQQGQLAPNFRLDVVGLTGVRGNPELQPFRARQFDLGGEYYLNRSSLLSLALFRKKISSFIFNTTQPEVVDGVTYTITLPVNGTQVVTINGFEAGAQVTFDFLPGALSNFGALANYTFQKDKGFESRDLITGGALPFPGLSRKSYNASLFYEDSRFSVRGSYNWRSEYLITPVGRGNNPEFGEAFGQFDASASFNLTPKITFFAEGVNILDATRIEKANSVYRRTIIETYGRRFYLGVRARL